MCILHDLPLRSRIAHGGRDNIKKAKSSAEFSTANMPENLLKLREKATFEKTRVHQETSRCRDG